MVENKLQSSPQLEDQNGTNDWKTTNKHKGELVMAYDNNASNKVLYPRTFYALYIGPNDSSTGHLIFKLSTNQILTTPKYKPVTIPDDLIEAINKMDTFTNKIQINYFDSDHYIAEEDHFDNTQNDNQEHCDDTDNSEHERYDELDNS